MTVSLPSEPLTYQDLLAVTEFLGAIPPEPVGAIVPPRAVPAAVGLDLPVPIYVMDGLDPETWMMVEGERGRRVLEGMERLGLIRRVA